MVGKILKMVPLDESDKEYPSFGPSSEYTSTIDRNHVALPEELQIDENCPQVTQPTPRELEAWIVLRVGGETHQIV